LRLRSRVLDDGLRSGTCSFSNKPFVRVYTYKRLGDDVNDFHAVKLLKFI
jgi:predicted phage gp36 major capsid-like protein